MIKHSYTEFFIQHCIMQDIIMPRHELAYISNTIHCIHKSNVKLHELDVAIQSALYTYLCKSFHILISYN